jgi:hypothetical protein
VNRSSVPSANSCDSAVTCGCPWTRRRPGDRKSPPVSAFRPPSLCAPNRKAHRWATGRRPLPWVTSLLSFRANAAADFTTA